MVILKIGNFPLKLAIWANHGAHENLNIDTQRETFKGIIVFKITLFNSVSVFINSILCSSKRDKQTNDQI